VRADHCQHDPIKRPVGVEIGRERPYEKFELKATNPSRAGALYMAQNANFSGKINPTRAYKPVTRQLSTLRSNSDALINLLHI
jgi:hypothetical protein